MNAEIAIVDRIEGHYAVVEVGDGFVDLPLELFHWTPREGDRLRVVRLRFPPSSAARVSARGAPSVAVVESTGAPAPSEQAAP